MPSSSRIASSLFIALCIAGAVFVAAGSSSDAPEGPAPLSLSTSPEPVEGSVPERVPAEAGTRGGSTVYGAGPKAASTVPAEAEPQADAAKSPEPGHSVLAANQVVAFYGKPGAPSMGILGEYSKESLAPLLEGYAKLYDEVNGELGVVPAFYIIYGTCWPGGEIGLLRQSVVEDYIRFAQGKGWLVIIDHQIGKYGVEESVRSMLPYLRFPNVHLAIDPEWRTTMPMKEIGSVTGAELNASQKLMEEYLEANDLPGVRMLVTHQFRASMIRDQSSVRADFARVALVHTADGFGPPALKRNTYAWNAKQSNMPIKGFKLFFKSKVPGAGSDDPLMRPEEVWALEPKPLVVMYQ